METTHEPPGLEKAGDEEGELRQREDDNGNDGKSEAPRCPWGVTLAYSTRLRENEFVPAEETISERTGTAPVWIRVPVIVKV